MAIRITAALLLVLLTFVPAKAEKAFTIGVTLSLTGRYQALGKMQKRGFELWQQHVNQAGGLLKRPVILKVHDDASDPLLARNIYRRMIVKEKVDWVFGPYSTPITAAVLTVTERHGYPLLITGASGDQLWEQGFRYIFGVFMPASKYPLGFLQLIVQKGLKDLAIVAADDSFSRTLAKATARWARRLRLKIVLFTSFAKGKANLTPQARAARLAGAQALLVCGHMNEAVNMARALHRLGWHPRAYYASVGPALSKYRQVLGEIAEGTFSSSLWEPTVGLYFAGGRRFINDFKSRFKMAPSYQAAIAYAAGMILSDAARNAGSLEHARLRNALLRMDTMTVIGRYAVDSMGRQKRHFPLVIQWQKGHKRVVWPQGLKETDAIFR